MHDAEVVRIHLCSVLQCAPGTIHTGTGVGCWVLWGIFLCYERLSDRPSEQVYDPKKKKKEAGEKHTTWPRSKKPDLPNMKKH